jgi:HSP20 family molecular chaperone IbpA
MKPVFKNILISSSSALIGGLVVLGALKLNANFYSNIDKRNLEKQNHEALFNDIFKKQKEISSHFGPLFKDDFFTKRDPFDSWSSGQFGAAAINEITKREDEDSVYYDITVEDINSTSVNTKVEDGYMTITGTTEKKNVTTEQQQDDGISARSIYKSTFNRTFPLPEDVDPNKMQMTAEKDKIILKFPKIKV